MNFDLTRDDYKQFIKDLRNIAKDPNRTSHGLPVLPPPPPDRNLAVADYIDIQLSAGGSASVTVRIRRHDLYLIGYRNQNGQWLEFSWADVRQLIPGSRFLGFGENYNDIGGLGNLETVGYQQLSTAINQLARTTDSDERKSALRLLAVMISEAARFDKLLNIFAESVRRYRQTAFEGWMATLINSWGDLSYRLLREDGHASDFHLPRGQGEGEEKEKEKEKEEKEREEEKTERLNNLRDEVGINSSQDAVVFLALLLGSYLPTGYLSRRPRSTNDIPVIEGQPLVEVFSVCIDNIDNKNYPGHIYGNITVTDGLGSFYLYNRARSNSESIRPYHIASLTGPYRSISMCQFFTISLNLKNRDGEPSRGEVSKGSFSRDIFCTSKPKHVEFLFQEVTGLHGSAKVYFAMLNNAVQAHVVVYLMSRRPAVVFGRLDARYTKFDYSVDVRKLYQTTLFNRHEENFTVVRSGFAIPLSRYMVAVPTSLSLIVEANLRNHATTGKFEIAKGVATFPPKTDGESVHDIDGDDGSVRVIVTWSALSDDDR